MKSLFFLSRKMTSIFVFGSMIDRLEAQRQKSKIKRGPREFPGGPVVRTLRFQCLGLGFNPWFGN